MIHAAATLCGGRMIPAERTVSYVAMQRDSRYPLCGPQMSRVITIHSALAPIHRAITLLLRGP